MMSYQTLVSFSRILENENHLGCKNMKAGGSAESEERYIEPIIFPVATKKINEKLVRSMSTLPSNAIPSPVAATHKN